MSKANSTENDVLDAVLRGIDPSWRANASRYIALHTADPGEAGTAITSEATYTNYARVSVVASSGFSAASGGSSSNTAQITFPQCGASGNTVTHVSIVDTASGAGTIIYSGALNSSLAVSLNITPLFAASGLTITED